MILVTGTKRSGTSMWMQILIGAGFPAFGEAFPADWKSSIEAANPEGFYESSLRHGIYYATNPNPHTGRYIFPEQVEKHVVKVFVPGLVRSDRAYIGRVIATVREWREYCSSVRRLYELEDAGRDREPPARMPPHLEWWSENYSLIRDITVRRYAAHVETYGRLIEQTERVIDEVVEWLGEGDAAGARDKVRPEHRHFDKPEVDEPVAPSVASVFDELYGTLYERRPLTGAFITQLNETQQALLPELRDYEARIAAERSARSGKG